MVNKNTTSNSSDIAIVGVSCKFPGANNYIDFWNNLQNGVNSIRLIPKTRWDIGRYYSSDTNAKNKSISKWCGIIDDVDKFDNKFFNISPKEASNMDPQQRLLMEETWHCIEDSGISIEILQKKITSVYVGVMAVDYRQEAIAPHIETNSYSCLGSYESILANRISYVFDLKGASLSINAACASSLVAINEARQSLLNNDCNYAFACGVNLNLHPWKYISFSKARMLSPDGQCKTFDKDANGYVPGEGVGVLLLQRLDEAIKEKNIIYGVIKGTSVNHVGKSLSITSPRVEAQKQVILQAYKSAKINPETVGYMEFHGTGTSLGDPIEIESATQAFREFSDKNQVCNIGSVKTNIGHLEAASGIAGVIKVLMMMKYRKIPPSLNIETLNPIIDFKNTPFRVITNLVDWNRITKDIPLRAGVSSFGFGGTNSHILLEEYNQDSVSHDSEEEEFIPFILSAKSLKSLENLIEKWKNFIKDMSFLNYTLNDICMTMMIGRKSFEFRSGAIIKSKYDIEYFLKNNQIISKRDNSQKWCLRIGEIYLKGLKNIKLFMGNNKVFENIINSLLKVLGDRIGGNELVNSFYSDVWSDYNYSLYHFIVSYSYSSSLIELGLYPDIVVGQGLGSWTSLAISGIVTVEDVISILSNSTESSLLKLCRPKIPFYDSVNNNIIRTFRFSEEYLHFILGEMNVENGIIGKLSKRINIDEKKYQTVSSEILTYYMEKAKVLMGCQFTFKKFIEEWDRVLKKIGYNIEMMLEDERILTDEVNEFRKEKMLILVIIISSLKRLNRKWQLDEKMIIEDQRLIEVVDLVNDRVIQKEIIVELLTSEKPNYAEAIKIINDNQYKMNLVNSYKYIKEFNQEIEEISDVDDWLKKSFQCKESPVLQNIKYIDVGKTDNIGDDSSLNKYNDTTKMLNINELLVNLWLDGVDICWEKAYSSVAYKKVQLPTYVFEKHAFWLSSLNGMDETTGSCNESLNSDITNNCKNNEEMLHPLVGKNTSTLMQESFTTILKKDDFFLSDHFIGDYSVLPGVAYIEMCRAAGEIAKDGKVRYLKNIVWSNPIVMKDKQKAVNILLNDRDDWVEYEINSLEDTGLKVVNGQGRLIFDNGENNKDIIMDIVEIRNRCDHSILGIEHYKSLYQLGLKLGDSFNTIQEIYYNYTEALSFIMLPEYLKNNQFKLHPSLMDAALQTALKLLDIVKNNDVLYIPFSIGEVEIIDELSDKCYVYVTQEDNPTLSYKVNKFQAKILDTNGKVLLIIRNIIFRPIQTSIEERENTKVKSNDMCFTTSWQRCELKGENSSATILNERILLFDTNLHTYNYLSENSDALVTLIMPGKCYKKLEDNKYEIDPTNKSDYNQLFEDLEKNNSMPNNVIHLWSKERFAPDYYNLRDQLDKGFYSMFLICKLIMQLKLFEIKTIIYAFYGFNQDFQPHYAAVSGFFTTIRLEIPKLMVKTVGFYDYLNHGEEYFYDELPRMLSEELYLDNNWKAHIVYQGNVRYVRTLEEIKVPYNINGSKYFKKDGVYLITGGAGGLGLAFAKYIAKYVEAIFVLTGRSEIQLHQEKAIDEIKKLGSEAIYIKSDVSKLDEVKKMINQVKTRFNKINGVIHSAGIIKDAYITNKRIEDAKEVIAPKLLGTVNLDNALKDEPLDFFIMFSSITAITGNLGQSDYTFANSFMDYFAEYRENMNKNNKRYGKTLSVNWNFCKDGGMNISKETEKMIEQTMGLKFTNKQNVLNAFEKAMESQAFQFISVEGERKKILKALNIDENSEENNCLESTYKLVDEKASNITGRTKVDESNEKNRLQLEIQKNIMRKISSILNIEESDIDLDEEMGVYGFDSISFTELSNRINEEYDIDITPAIFFEYGTLKAFVEFLIEAYKDKFENFYNSLQTEYHTVKKEAAVVINNNVKQDFIYDMEQEDNRSYNPNIPNKLMPKEKINNEPIAIIGMHGVMPQSDNLDIFWNNLKDGNSLISEIPKDRWDWREYYGDPKKQANKTNVKWGGFINDVDKFDADFFNISPREAELMDPQQRIFLQTAWKTIEDAGYKVSDLSKIKTGVFVGVCTSDYFEVLKENNINTEAYTTTGSFHCILSNRISYLLDLNGPSVSIDTACSSSLVAMRQAVESIWSGSSEVAIVGGVNIMVSPTVFISFSKAGMLSVDGKCKTFDKDANGYVRGEGAGAVLLKPLSKAIADRDNIYAVIKGISVNHGGRVNSLTVPNPNAQAQLIIKAFEDGGIAPETVNYIEAHGTGTRLGDPIEINGLKKAFKEMFVSRGKTPIIKAYCGIGSVKTNIGHLEAGAGISGLLKVLLSLKYKMIPKSINLIDLNPYIKLDDSPFYIVNETKYWERLQDNKGNEIPRRAGVSSFGFGGVNAHVIVEEYEESVNHFDEKCQKEFIIILSAKNEGVLKEYAKDICNFIERNISSKDLEKFEEVETINTLMLKNMAYTFQVGREEMEQRLALVVSSLEELKDRLYRYYTKDDYENIHRGQAKSCKLVEILSSNSGREFIINSIKNKEYENLAELWVSGIEIDWRLMYDDMLPCRISLPTYPFQKTRYWVECNLEQGCKRTENDNVYTMIDGINEILSLDEGIVYQKEFNKKDNIIKDHCVLGENVFPGVGYLEMIMESMAQIKQGTNLALSNIVWQRACIFQSERKNLYAYIKKNKSEMNYEIRDGAEENSITYFKGKASCFDLYLSKEELKLDIDSIKSRLKPIANWKKIYKDFTSMRLEYGSYFKGLRFVWGNDKEAVGILELMDEYKDEINTYILHPTIMDAALQIIEVLQINGVDKVFNPYLPFSVGKIDIYNSVLSNSYGYVKKVGSNTYDVVITDNEGHVCVKIYNFVVREVKEQLKDFSPKINNILPSKDNSFRELYYEPIWEKTNLEEGIEKGNISGTLVIFDTNEKLRNRLNTKLNNDQNKDLRIILVRQGNIYKQCSDLSFEINYKNNLDYNRLIEDILNLSDISKPLNIILYWSKERFQTDVYDLKTQLDKGIYSLFYIYKYLRKNWSQSETKILYVYNGDKDEIQPQYEAVSGFAKSVHLESSKIKIKTIQVDSKYESENLNGKDLSDILLGELEENMYSGVDLKYINGVRWQKSIREIPQKINVDNKVLRKNGVYIITGGTGGLGIILAEYLAKHFKARLVLVGRSCLSEDKERKILDILANGAEVAYIKGNISVQADVENIVKETKARFKEINGIIHCAGIIKDSLISNKTKEDMEMILAPKVYGTVLLDKATRNDTLDFFALFSSCISIFGNAGQSDYAFGNGFLDSYAHFREKLRLSSERNGKTISINWPLWESGGMTVNKATETFFENTMGIKAIDSKVGVENFICGLNSSVEQLMFVMGNSTKIHEFLKIKKSISQMPDEKVSDLQPETIIKQVYNYLLTEVSRILKLNRSDLDIELDMSEYGFDSITFTELANTLNEKYSIQLMPSIFFEYASLRSFAEFLLKENEKELLSYYSKEFEIVDNLSEASADNKEKEDNNFDHINLEKIDNFKTNESNGEEYVDDPIAIIGISGVFPQSENLNDFWKNIEEGKNLITEIPSDRWNWKEYYGDPKDAGNRTNVKWGGFLKEIDKFDPMFFGISPREARMMDPQQRIFLEIVWRTVEDAGYKIKDISGSKTGLFIGVSTSDYSDLIREYDVEYQAQVAIGNLHSMLANRISYFLNIHGPSEPIDTACSSSIVAIHKAVQSIKNGECSMAIAGGINVLASPTLYLSFSKAGMLSSDGSCKTFDKHANGYVRGEGAGAILLKPLSRAENDGDNIYAVIRGSSINHGGRASSLTAPNPNAQTELLVNVYKNAKVDPSTVSYIETHGTGTALGDPIEINSLKNAFSQLQEYWNKKLDESYCALGALKTNIGHLEAASGIASVIKVILAMKHRKIPTNINFKELNPYIQLEGSPFYIVTKNQTWDGIYDEYSKEFIRRAGVSSFGFGGVNSHIILEDYNKKQINDENSIKSPHLIVISAKNEERLKEYAKNIIDYLGINAVQNQTDLQSLRSKIEVDVIDIIAKILGVYKCDISVNESFSEYGFDIVLLSEMVKEINSMYGIDINSILPVECNKISLFIDFLLQNYSDILQKFYGVVLKGNNEIAKYQEVSISNISYTLQVGREEMNERLAFIVYGISDMKNTLEEFCTGRNKDTGIYTGNVKNDKGKNHIFVHENKEKEYIKSAIEAHDFEKIAQCWVSGIRIEWGDLYKGRKPLKISLPTYPFAKERYWINDVVTKHGKSYEEENRGDMNSENDIEIIDESELEINNYCYKPFWTENNFNVRSILLKDKKLNIQQDKNNIIIFYSRDINEINKLFAFCHNKDEVIFVKLGRKNEQISYENREIDVFDKEAIKNFIRNQKKIDIIYYLFFNENSNVTRGIYDEIDEQQERGVISLLRLVKYLNEYGWNRKTLSLKIVTNNTYSIVGDEDIIPYSASIQGMAKGLTKEYPIWNVYGIDVSLDELQDYDKDNILKKVIYPIVNWISEKNAADTGLRHGKVYIKKLKPIKFNSLREHGFKHNGVYMILGGMGRIGFEQAKYLASNFYAHIVIIGRSSLDKEKQNKLLELEQLGGKAIYFQCNCADFNELNNIFEEVKNRYGKINGIIHSAMQFNTGIIKNMNEELFRFVLEPKIKVCAVLEKVLKGNSVDFVMFFSSADVFTPIMGHSAYIAGCCFEDAFATYLNKFGRYHVKVINWGYWETTEEQLKRLGREGAYLKDNTLAENGIQPLSPIDGMDVIEHVIQNPELQVIAMKVDSIILRNLNIESDDNKVIINESKSLISNVYNHFIKYDKQGSLKIEQR